MAKTLKEMRDKVMRLVENPPKPTVLSPLLPLPPRSLASEPDTPVVPADAHPAKP